MATRIVAPSGPTPATASVDGVTKKRKIARAVAKPPKADAAKHTSSTAAEAETLVSVPMLRQTYRKAPKVDPYLRPETVTEEVLRFGDIELPPILRGIEPGRSFSGNEPQDYPVRVIWISRRQIDWVLGEIVSQHPELDTVLHIVSKWMCHLDTMRAELGYSVGSAANLLQGERPNVPLALEALDSAMQQVGHFHDDYRLHLR